MFPHRNSLEHVIAEFLQREETSHVDRSELLEAHPELRVGLESFFSIYDQPPLSTATQESNSTSLSHRALPAMGWSPSPGQKLGRYRLLRTIGVGAFGQVWLGYDEQLRRPVAVKLPSANRQWSEGEKNAFIEEARVIAAMDHPNIVSIFDIGWTSEGVVYLITQFINGLDLSTLIHAQRPTIQQSVNLVADIAAALAYAHDRNLVHRDVKPSNILIDATSRTPYITDFGLAIGANTSTPSGSLAGTSAYMSPEQARGDRRGLDGRSDLFSLGVVLFELLTCSRPFIGHDQTEILDSVLHFDPQFSDDSIPLELRRICLKMLEKNREDRYDHGQAVADALHHWQPEPEARAEPQPPSLASRFPDSGTAHQKLWSADESTLRARTRKRRLTWTTTALVTTVLIVAIAATIVSPGHSEPTVDGEKSMSRAAATTGNQNRKVAVMTLELGGSVDIECLGDSFEVQRVFDLPKEEFNIEWVMLPNIRHVDDAFVDELIQLPNLSGVDLTKSSTTAKGLARLQEIESLEYIYARDTPVNDDVIKAFCQLPHLVGLSLADTDITDDALKMIASHPTLRELNIMGTKVTDVGMKHLSPMHQLQLLRISGTDVGDEGIAHLSDLRNVILLWAEDTRMTDRALVAMKSWPLEELNYSKGTFSPKALSEFQQLHPECRMIEE